jgi:phospho-N-acetylmuramoyl-pentapeptide-transferase
MPIFIAIAGFIYALEVISVIMQVSYFKITHGKRIFRMAPIHHHFEKGGWSETKVVNVFTTITILLCLLSYAGL